jgi:hypothetical protein
MEIAELIQQIKNIIEENELHVDNSSKAKHWLYRSSASVIGLEEIIDDELIMILKFEDKRKLNKLCDDLSFIKETIENLEKMVMNELNYREFGTAEHTREWW